MEPLFEAPLTHGATAEEALAELVRTLRGHAEKPLNFKGVDTVPVEPQVMLFVLDYLDSLGKVAAKRASAVGKADLLAKELLAWKFGDGLPPDGLDEAIDAYLAERGEEFVA